MVLGFVLGKSALAGESQGLESECELCLEGNDFRSRVFNGQLGRILEEAKQIINHPQE